MSLVEVSPSTLTILKVSVTHRPTGPFAAAPGAMRAVGGEKAEHGGHVGMDHAASPWRMPPMRHSLPPSGERRRPPPFSTVSVVMMASAASSAAVVARGLAASSRHRALDGLNGQRLADDAGGGDDHVVRASMPSAVGRDARTSARAFSTPSALQVLALPLLQMHGLGAPVGEILPRHGRWARP